MAHGRTWPILSGCRWSPPRRPATAEERAAELGLALPRPLRLAAPASCASQAEYLEFFDHPIAVMQTAEGIARTARELGEDAAADGIEDLEVRWAPRFHLRRGLSVERGIEAGRACGAAAPVRAVAIVCAIRQHPVEENVAL